MRKMIKADMKPQTRCSQVRINDDQTCFVNKLFPIIYSFRQIYHELVILHVTL